MKSQKQHSISLLFLISAALCQAPIAAWGQHAAHSVLSTGQWWKAEIPSSGIYTLNTSDIEALSGSAIDDIALYGVRGGVLPVLNGSPRADDLAEMAIEVHDNNGDGRFDNDDYIVFYATGADRWEKDPYTNRYQHVRHPYAAANGVYITVSQGDHKRIATTPNTGQTGSAVTTCTALAVHDRDLSNAYASGQVWVGEYFNATSNRQTIHVPLPATPTGNIYVRFGLASVGKSGANFAVVMGGTPHHYALTANNQYNTFSDIYTDATSDVLDFDMSYSCSDNLASGYLDFIEVSATVPMTLRDNMTFLYVDGSDGLSHPHTVGGATATSRVWDVSDYNDVKQMAATYSDGALTFSNFHDRNRIYVVFNPEAIQHPTAITSVANQDLHGEDSPDLVIVCHSSLRNEAQRLANLHSLYDDMKVLTVTQDEVFNEFSGGQRDPVAIRELMRMFYYRSNNDSGQRRPRHLLLFGKGSYDNKNLLSKDYTTVVTYETPQSFDDNGSSYASDDFYTFLDDGESNSIYESHDISIGRLPAKNESEAKHLVDKIERYITRVDLMDGDIRSDWRNSIALLADDADPSCPGDTNFTSSQEITARQIEARYPQYTIDKIYADAFVQQSGADGSYYPDVNNALQKRLDYGCLLLNYIGHGSDQYIGTERFMMKSNISNYKNFKQLPFFITSTCSFGRYDMADGTCGGEEFVLADGAGIACLAATRPISHIQASNTDIVMQSLNPQHTIGDAIRIAKNNRPTTMALTLMGDPALRLSFPDYRVVVTHINGRAVSDDQPDSAMVLSTVTVEGEIQDSAGRRVEDFDGILFPAIYDRAQQARTLSNDNENCAVAFTQQNSLLYKGRTAVRGGRFSYHFIVPRDVAYKYERAKICHYAKSDAEDATGSYTNLLLGGYDESVNLDVGRPQVKLFINDTNFRNGAITDENPTLLVKLYDSIGINAVGSGLGHDITATLDGNPNSILSLNDFYETDVVDEHYGSIRYSLSNLTPGRHSIVVKAWNIYNLSNSAEVVFYVKGSGNSETHFNASPNPASDYTLLRMEHNIKGTIVSGELQVYDMRGARLYTTAVQCLADSYVVGPVRWNLCTDSGKRVSPGVYIARFIVTTDEGDKICEQGKIVIK